MKRIESDNYTHWKGKFTGRKGMGMELALLVLFVVFACSTLLVSSALLSRQSLNDRTDQMLLRFELDRLAEKALAGEPTEDNGNYRVVPSANGLEITDADGTVLLTVTLNGDKIIGWQYH